MQAVLHRRRPRRTVSVYDRDGVLVAALDRRKPPLNVSGPVQSPLSIWAAADCSRKILAYSMHNGTWQGLSARPEPAYTGPHWVTKVFNCAGVAVSNIGILTVLIKPAARTNSP